MVLGSLEEDAVPERLRSEIVSYAVCVVNRRARFRGILVGLAGILLACFGVALFFVMAFHFNVFAKFSSVIIMTGLMMAIYGLFETVRVHV